MWLIFEIIEREIKKEKKKKGRLTFGGGAIHMFKMQVECRVTSSLTSRFHSFNTRADVTADNSKSCVFCNNKLQSSRLVGDVERDNRYGTVFLDYGTSVDAVLFFQEARQVQCSKPSIA